MSHSLAAILGGQSGNNPHPLLPEAQRANLEAAWAYYSTPKDFRPGDLVRCREGMSTQRDEPVIMLFVRSTDDETLNDVSMIDDELRRHRWAKVDCIVMRTNHEGAVFFIPFDKDLLELVL